jgi:DnaA family protein
MSASLTVPEQLLLPMRLRASSVFASYYPGGNQAALAMLQDLSRSGPSPLLFLYGAASVGKTHLLQALCARAGEQQQMASYLPLREYHHHGPELLQGAEHMAVVCLDDVSKVLADAQWNHALFKLHHQLEEQGGKLVMADTLPPAAQPFVLRDLSSRVLAGSVLRLQPLTEADQTLALQLHAQQRGLELPDEVSSYLQRRLPRDMSALCTCLDQLDLASLSAQRKLTVPFVKQVLLGSDV